MTTSRAERGGCWKLTSARTCRPRARTKQFYSFQSQAEIFRVWTHLHLTLAPVALLITQLSGPQLCWHPRPRNPANGGPFRCRASLVFSVHSITRASEVSQARSEKELVTLANFPINSKWPADHWTSFCHGRRNSRPRQTPYVPRLGSHKTRSEPETRCHRKKKIFKFLSFTVLGFCFLFCFFYAILISKVHAFQALQSPKARGQSLPSDFLNLSWGLDLAEQLQMLIPKMGEEKTTEPLFSGVNQEPQASGVFYSLKCIHKLRSGATTCQRNYIETLCKRHELCRNHTFKGQPFKLNLLQLGVVMAWSELGFEWESITHGRMGLNSCQCWFRGDCTTISGEVLARSGSWGGTGIEVYTPAPPHTPTTATESHSWAIHSLSW